MTLLEQFNFDIIERMSKNFVCEVGLSKRLCPTGEPYIVLGIGGIKCEGEQSRMIADLNKAIEQFIGSFDEYSKDKAGTLYWRSYPTIDFDGYEDAYRITARFIITDKPVLKEEDAISI